ncbi:MAG: glycosyltransferase family 39 protein [Chthoniobacterales bacterium]
MKEKSGAICACLLVLAIVALTRLPFLTAGYGANVDAWRVAHVARVIAETGEYQVSRFPGNPVHEIICSWLRFGGPVALNGLSATFSVAAALALWLIARELQCRDTALLTLAFGATPIIFVNSVTTKDYIWAIAFVLWAFYAAMRQRPVICGLLLGLAVGCRLTSGIMFLPLAMVLYGSNRGGNWRQRGSRFAIAAALTGTLMFLPVWMRYGWEFLTFYTHPLPSFITLVFRGTLEIWGALGIAGLLIAFLSIFFFRRNAFPPAMPKPGNRFVIPALAATILLYLFAFVRLPHQAGYLIPIIPAVLLFAARFAPRRAFQIACVCLFVAPWIDLTAGLPKAGPILADRAERIGTMRDVQQFVMLTEQALPTQSTVVVGAWEPILSELFAAERLRHDYVYSLSRVEVAQVLATGRGIAYTSDVIRGFNARIHGFDLARFGAVNLRQSLVGQP